MRIMFYKVIRFVCRRFSRDLEFKLSKKIIRLQKDKLGKLGYNFNDEWYDGFLGEE